MVSIPPEATVHSVDAGYNSGAALDGRCWTQIFATYRKLNHARSVAESVITTFPLVALWIAAWFTFWLGYARTSPLIAIPAAGFLMRLCTRCPDWMYFHCKRCSRFQMTFVQ